VAATLNQQEDGLFVIFDDLMKSITAGQFVAWYRDGELVGSGVIQA